MRPSLMALLLSAGVLSSAGCGGMEFAPVSGTLTQGSKPVANVRVEFWPEGEGVKSSGVTDEQGRYSLTAEDGETPGAVVGPHRVILKDLTAYGDVFLGRKAENMADLGGGKKPRIPATPYGDPAQTPFKTTVNGGGPNTFDIPVP